MQLHVSDFFFRSWSHQRVVENNEIILLYGDISDLRDPLFKCISAKVQKYGVERVE